MNGYDSDIRAWPIAVLRAYAGLFFLYYGIDKLMREDFNVGRFLEAQAGNAFEFYRPIMESVLIPNAGLFSSLVAWGETALGVALVIGLATRYAALAGAFMVANFWFAKGTDVLAATNHDVVWIAVLLTLAFVPAGKIFGLDQRLSNRFAFLR